LAVGMSVGSSSRVIGSSGRVGRGRRGVVARSGREAR
jgi:hypothetical protein